MTSEDKVKAKVGELPTGKTDGENIKFDRKAFLRLAAKVKNILDKENEEPADTGNRATT